MQNAKRPDWLKEKVSRARNTPMSQNKLQQVPAKMGGRAAMFSLPFTLRRAGG
jgi:hypothetical protein